MLGVQAGVTASAIEVAAHRRTHRDDERRPPATVAYACPQAGTPHAPVKDQIADEPSSSRRVGQPADPHEKIREDTSAFLKVFRKALQERPQQRTREWSLLKDQQLAKVFSLARKTPGERWDRKALDKLLSQKHTRILFSMA